MQNTPIPTWATFTAALDMHTTMQRNSEVESFLPMQPAIHFRKASYLYQFLEAFAMQQAVPVCLRAIVFLLKRFQMLFSPQINLHMGSWQRDTCLSRTLWDTLVWACLYCCEVTVILFQINWRANERQKVLILRQISVQYCKEWSGIHTHFERGWCLGDQGPCNLEVERLLGHSLPFH